MRALVTGAAAGLGRAMTLELNRLGASVLALDRDAAGLAVLAGEGGAVAPLTLDLADRQAVLGAMDEIASFGPFDFVVLNAGISATGKFEEIPDTAHRAVLAVNAVAPMLIASGLASREACAPGCRLVFVSSLSHRTGYPGAAS
jgi:cyclic-di-GMP-binding biofilm dispersal mediator protein